MGRHGYPQVLMDINRKSMGIQHGYPRIDIHGYPAWIIIMDIHHGYPGFRRLTRDSRNRHLTRNSRIPDLSCKKSGKIVKIGFLDSQDQNKILNFL